MKKAIDIKKEGKRKAKATFSKREKLVWVKEENITRTLNITKINFKVWSKNPKCIRDEERYIYEEFVETISWCEELLKLIKNEHK